MKLKNEHPKKNVNLPIDSYVPIDYFTKKDIFIMKYNVAQR